VARKVTNLIIAATMVLFSADVPARVSSFCYILSEEGYTTASNFQCACDDYAAHELRRFFNHINPDLLKGFYAQHKSADSELKIFVA